MSSLQGWIVGAFGLNGTVCTGKDSVPTAGSRVANETTLTSPG
jgi:hypothetical protein